MFKLLVKSQVAAFTRKDGVMVQAHDSGKQAAAPHEVVKQHAVAAGAKYRSNVSVFSKPELAHSYADMTKNGKGGAFVMKHPDHDHHVVVGGADAQRMEKNGYQHAGGKQAAPPLAAHHEALRTSSKDGDLDHWHNQVAADHMKNGDHEALSGTLRNMDTAARDHVLEHIHPDHHEGLGFTPISKARSLSEYGDKFPAKPAPKQRLLIKKP